MRAAPIACAAFLIASGCYASSELEEAHSGTRLRARRWVPASGPPTFIGWRDTELDVDCWFRVAEDGERRCLPEGPVGHPYYADPGCTDRLLEVSPIECGDPLRYTAAFEASDGCASGPRSMVVHELGAAMSFDRVYELRDGACVEAEGAPETFRPLTHVSPERFVRADVEAPSFEDGARLGRSRLDADDGSRQLGEFHDREIGECRAWASGATPRGPCAPLGTAPPISSCDGEYVSAGYVCEPPGFVIQSTEPDECDGTSELLIREVGPEPEPLPRSCRGSDAGYPIGGDASEDLGWVTLTSASGPERLQPLIAVDDAGRTLSIGSIYHDREMGLDCVPVAMSDGAVRCVPMLSASDVAVDFLASRGPFADPECTMPAVLFPAGCPIERRFVWEGSDTDAPCGDPARDGAVREVGEPLEVAYRRDRETGDCVVYESDGSLVGARLSAPLPWDRLATLEERID